MCGEREGEVGRARANVVQVFSVERNNTCWAYWVTDGPFVRPYVMQTIRGAHASVSHIIEVCRGGVGPEKGGLGGGDNNTPTCVVHHMDFLVLHVSGQDGLHYAATHC